MQGIKKYFSILMLLFIISSCTNIQKTAKYKKKNSAFSKDQTALIMEGDSSLAMRIFKITNKEDSVLLRTKSTNVKVDPSDPVLKNFVLRLKRTIQDSLSMGVGIAAPQVGILKNIIWIQRFDKENFPFEIYLNPEIIQYSTKKQSCREGCLSIPNRSDTLNSRAYAILIEYDKMDQSHHTEMIEDFTAVIFQHEIDHLKGILYIDHLAEEIKDAKQ